ncbi:ATP-binding protein [Paenibacillus andongensis]|uniref:ATP-binding protein n=1 Tax=Paenibacillus andongensis TaxID=2975482 RepID=UPI0021BB08F4|nr:sensor histidine kinase [Paenibacillus andongensis]
MPSLSLTRLKPIKLRTKINLLVLLNMALVLILLLSAISYIIVDRRFKETGERALVLARTVAGLPQIMEGLQTSQAAAIQPLADLLRKQSGAEFIVVADKNLIRYSHPNPEKIGKTLNADDLPLDQHVLKGREIQTTSTGSLGLSVRGKTPVLDAEGNPIGLVSVGFLVKDIWKDLLSLLLNMFLIGFAALFIGLVGAYLLSGHIKKQIFNMEPGEIAFLTQQQAAILDSTREGIIAVNSKGIIMTCNREAKKLLNIAGEDITGQAVHEVLPQTRLLEVLKEGAVHQDAPMIVGNTLIITNRVPVYANGKIIGAVATFRDKLQLDQIGQKLADIGQYIDSLRSQRHEFMNKLHLISGLIKMKEYEMVEELIEEINEEQQHLLDFFLSKIHDPAVVGVLIGKMHRAKEKGIQLIVDSESTLPNPCPHRDIILTFIGNSIENALEALSTTYPARGAIIVQFREEKDHICISVQDNGPGVDPGLKDKIFQDGISTKGTGRGFGLALLSKMIKSAEGQIWMESTSSGAILHAILPK